MKAALNSKLQSRIDSASEALAARDYRGCHEHCIAAIKIDPRCGEPYFLLSILTADHGNLPKALEIIDMAVKHEGRQPRFLAQRSKCLALLNRHEEAAEIANEVSRNELVDDFALETLGVVFSRVGEHAKAVPLFKQASANSPSNAEFQYNLGASLQFSGSFAEAETAYQRAIKLKPDHYKAHYGLASLRNQSAESGRLERMIDLFDKCSLPDDALHLGHAIAKTHEDMNSYQAALQYLLQAKEMKRKSLGYEFSDDLALFEAAHKLADIEIEPLLSDGQGPLFIVGMPRTGTSLVDRILSSHSKVVSMGELAHFGLLLKQKTGTASAFVLDTETLDQAMKTDLASVGESYLRVTSRLRSTSPHFIDKMPLNFFYAPLILATIPNARVLCVRRNAMDTCLSNFRQLFSTSYSYYNYSYSLEDTGRYFLEFDRLVETWCDTLPEGRFMTVQYEDVIADQERETRRLLGFCGLAFEDACLQFHSNPAPIATASSVQVRSPIYTSSIDRWKKFGSALAPLEKLIRSAKRL